MAMTNNRWDALIRNATVYDGSGDPPVRADVALRGDRIAAVGQQLGGEASAELDATGLAVAPGFIDVHSHDDVAVLVEPEIRCKTLQSVTTEVGGNCGMGVAPYRAAIGVFGPRCAGIETHTPWDRHGGCPPRAP